jgi:hypothetical protein
MSYLKDFLEKCEAEAASKGEQLSVLSVPPIGPYTPSNTSPEGDPGGQTLLYTQLTKLTKPSH